MSCVKSKDGASMSRSIGLCLGRGKGGPATVLSDWGWDCASAEPPVNATTINAVEAAMTARKRSCNIRDYIDDEADDRADEEKRKNRMHQGDATDPRRGDGYVGCLITYGNRKRVIHEVPEIRSRAFGKIESRLIGRFTVDDRVVVVELHVVKPKINMSQEPR